MNKEQLLPFMRHVRNLLSDPARWTQKQWAVSAKNRAVQPTSKRAVRWCLVGAIAYVDASCEIENLYIPICDLRDIYVKMGATSTELVDINDTSPYEFILKGIDTYIQELESVE